MKLNLIGIYEGFGLKGDNYTHQAMFSDEADFSPLVTNSGIYFNPTDAAEDLVKVVPALKAESLEEYVDPERLGNFTGTVYYGFKTTTAEDYSNSVLDQTISTLQDAINLSRDPLLSISKAYELANGLKNPARHQRLDRSGRIMQPDLAGAAVYEKAADLATQLRKLYKLGLYEKDYRLDTVIGKIKRVTQSKFVKEAEIAFAKRLKHPGPEDREVLNTFLDMCVDQLSKMPRTAIAYDYVVAPESGSEFNKALADKIAATRGSELLTIHKRLGKDVTVDKQQLTDRANMEAPTHLNTKSGKWEYKRRDGSGTRLYDTEQEFVDAWAGNEYDKAMKNVENLPQDSPAKIKSQDHLDKRRYYKIMSSQGAEVAADKSVLIIDDNIVRGSTVELVYEVLATLPTPPRRIDIFVPLLLTNVRI